MKSKFDLKSIFIVLLLCIGGISASLAADDLLDDLLGSLADGTLTASEQAEHDAKMGLNSQHIYITSGETVLGSFPRKIDSISFDKDSGFSIRTLEGGEWKDMTNNPADYDPMQGYIIRNFSEGTLHISVVYAAVSSADQTLFQKQLKAGWNLYAPAVKNDYCGAVRAGDALAGTNYSQLIDFSTLGFDKLFSQEIKLNAYNTNTYSGEAVITEINSERGRYSEFINDGDYKIKTASEADNKYIYEGGAYGVFVNNDTLASGNQNVTNGAGQELREYVNHSLVVFNDNAPEALNITNTDEVALLDFNLTSKYNGTDENNTASVISRLAFASDITEPGVTIYDQFSSIRLLVNGVEKDMEMNMCTVGSSYQCNIGAIYADITNGIKIAKGDSAHIQLMVQAKQMKLLYNRNIKFDRQNTLILDSVNLLPYCGDQGYILGTVGYTGRDVNIDTMIDHPEVPQAYIDAANILADQGIIDAEINDSDLINTILLLDSADVTRKAAGLGLKTTCDGIFADVTATSPNTEACYSIEAIADQGFVFWGVNFTPELPMDKITAVYFSIKAAGMDFVEDNNSSLSFEQQVVDYAVENGIVAYFTDYNSHETRGWFYRTLVDAMIAAEDDDDLLTDLLGGLSSFDEEVTCDSDPVFSANSCGVCYNGGTYNQGSTLNKLNIAWRNASDVNQLIYKEEQLMPMMINLNGSEWIENNVNPWVYSDNFESLYDANEVGYILPAGNATSIYHTNEGVSYTLTSSTGAENSNNGLLKYSTDYHNILENGDVTVDLNEVQHCVLLKNTTDITLSAPENITLLDSSTESLTVGWDVVDGANYYEIVYSDSELAFLLDGGGNSVTSTTNQVTIPNLDSGKTYYMQIVGFVDVETMGEWSDLVNFDTDGEAIPTVLNVENVPLADASYVRGATGITGMNFQITSSGSSDSIFIKEIRAQVLANGVAATNQEVTAVKLLSDSGEVLGTVSGSALSGGTATFSGLTGEHSTGVGAYYFIDLDLADTIDAVSNSPLSVHFVGAEIEDINNNVLPFAEGVLDIPLASGKDITVTNAGELNISYDSNDELNEDPKTILAGTSEMVFSVDVLAANESINVGEVIFNVDKDLINAVQDASLYLGDTLISTNSFSNITTGSISFPNLTTLIIPEFQSELKLKINTNPIGFEKVGETVKDVMVTSISMNDLEGVNSGKILTDGFTSVNSALFSIVPGKILAAGKKSLDVSGTAEMIIYSDVSANTQDATNTATRVKLDRFTLVNNGFSAGALTYTLSNTSDSSDVITGVVNGNTIDFTLSEFATASNRVVTSSNTYKITVTGTTEGDTVALELPADGIIYSTDNADATGLVIQNGQSVDLGTVSY